MANLPALLRSAVRRAGRASLLFGFCWLVLSTAPPVLGSTTEDSNARESYPSISGPCELGFPEDHRDHPEHRTEWWYYTGNLTSEQGSRYGYQLTFFRSRMRPAGQKERQTASLSAWRTSQLFLAHAALTDITGKRFYHGETLARGALGMAGVERGTSVTTIRVRNWSARIAQNEHSLRASSGDFSLELALSALKPPVLHGNGGHSLKGESPESASCYYSLTRLETEGTVAVGGVTLRVKGLSWMDHEFSSAPLEKGIVGWDWLSLQLSNGTELMLYLMRKTGGGTSPVSSGTFVLQSGESIHLGREQIEIEVLDHWVSPRSEARYPSRWRLRIPSHAMELLITPTHADQELQTPESTRITYWEGSVDAAGTMGDQAITARGYVELTGYAQPMDARF